MGDARAWTHAALFGALWGGLEATVGTALRLAGVPLRGLLMASLALLCLVCLRRLQPRPGVCLLAGAVAVVLKLSALGGLVPGPVLAMSLQAGLVEAAFLLGGTRRIAAAAAGALILAAIPLQKVLMVWAVAGLEPLRASEALLAAASAALLGFAVEGAALIAALAAAAAVAGLGAGWVAWGVAGRVARRTGAG